MRINDIFAANTRRGKLTPDEMLRRLKQNLLGGASEQDGYWQEEDGYLRFVRHKMEGNMAGQRTNAQVKTEKAESVTPANDGPLEKVNRLLEFLTPERIAQMEAMAKKLEDAEWGPAGSTDEEVQANRRAIALEANRADGWVDWKDRGLAPTVNPKPSGDWVDWEDRNGIAANVAGWTLLGRVPTASTDRDDWEPYGE